MQETIQHFIRDIENTSLLEYIAVFAGIISVVFSRIENVWVYPTGLINTIIYIYISLKASLIGEASVNFYYTVMSLYGWWLWTRKDRKEQLLVKVTFSNKKEWMRQILFFLFFYVVIFGVLSLLKKEFPAAIPWADAFASATAYTGMWLMARKKVESWWWWIATNLASIPLYYVKGLVFTSVYYVVLLVLAVSGLAEWKLRGKSYWERGYFRRRKHMKKIVVIGPESTGKSTLCKELAEHYNTVWCPEYAREYLLQNGTNYTYEDLNRIAQGQLTMEDYLQEDAKRAYYFVDTDMCVMKVWYEVVFRNCPTWILKTIARRRPDLYLLCNTDLPWMPDKLREYPDLKLRQQHFATYKDIVLNSGVPWAVISGTEQQRLKKAVEAVDDILKINFH